MQQFLQPVQACKRANEQLFSYSANKTSWMSHHINQTICVWLLISWHTKRDILIFYPSLFWRREKMAWTYLISNCKVLSSKFFKILGREIFHTHHFPFSYQGILIWKPIEKRDAIEMIQMIRSWPAKSWKLKILLWQLSGVFLNHLWKDTEYLQ